MLSIFFRGLATLFYTGWSSSLVYLFLVRFFLLIFSNEFLYNKISLFTELDYVSNSLIILRFWVRALCILARQKIFTRNNSSKKFIILIIFLLIFLYFSFSFNNFLLFYLRFECSILPVLFLILGWGYQPERVQAGLYLVFYTMFASLPLLVLILSVDNNTGLSILLTEFYLKRVNGVVNLFLVGAFLVKFPIYITHLWLPKAHVEAPVAGSMILAGVLLKLGGYGLIRFLSLRREFPLFLQRFLVFFSVWGGFLVSLNCLSHTDIKSLIACSSVVHIRTCIGGLLILNEWGKQGCILILIAHGLCSSGLFFLVGLIYNLTRSRSLFVNKGLIIIIPSLSLWWFLLLACNIACPPTINLLAEIEIISGLLSWNYLLRLPLALLAFFSCAYRIFLFSLRQHGKYFFGKQGFHSGYILDYFILVCHWVPLNLFILFVGFIICLFSLFKILLCGGKEVFTRDTDFKFRFLFQQSCTTMIKIKDLINRYCVINTRLLDLLIFNLRFLIVRASCEGPTISNQPLSPNLIFIIPQFKWIRVKGIFVIIGKNIIREDICLFVFINNVKLILSNTDIVPANDKRIKIIENFSFIDITKTKPLVTINQDKK